MTYQSANTGGQMKKSANMQAVYDGGLAQKQFILGIIHEKLT
jgi:hypothetical protein